MEPVPKPFSSRTGWNLAETAYARAVREARSSGRRLYDLTASNPTTCGFQYDQASILAPLCNAASLTYDPDPRGILAARQAVAGYYADHGAEVSPQQIVLTTSTSEAYSFLFRLLCDPGDEVLVAQPGYPLFAFLADLDDVRLNSYPLFYDHGWHIDLEMLERRITPRTRAILLVHPNNPTGHFTGTVERARVEALCQRHGLALIVDEVFLDYGLASAPGNHSFMMGAQPVLTFVLSGMSKIAGLPQMKVAWVATAGPEPARQQALARLEVIADTFLSMNAPAQHALPLWLAGRGGMQQQIQERVAANLVQLDRVCLPGSPMQRLRLEAGWNAILRVPANEDDQTLALRLLAGQGTIVHPGSFYGMEPAGRLVVSLICPEADFAAGLERIALA